MENSLACHRIVTSAPHHTANQGGNIFGDSAENCAMYFTANGDLLSTDPGVEPGAPADHGGPTPTILLTPNAPAIDGGQDLGLALLGDEQVRELTACDVGAIEMQ